MRRWRIPCAVAIVSMAWAGVQGSASSASTPKPPKFAGAAPGAVTCSLTAKLRFSSPLTESGGVTTTTVKGKLRSCSSTTGSVSIKKGTLTGSFSGSPINCVGPSSGTATGGFSISWKGEVNGVVRTASYAGKATIDPTAVLSTGEQLVTELSGQEGLQLLGSESGSFPGGVSMAAFSADTASQLTAMCETKTTVPSGNGKGVKKLDLTGTITVGMVGQLASDGTGYCAVLASGTVNCWGSGTDGALGNNSVAVSRVPVIINVTTATGIASDGTHSYCATLTSGSVDCWGLNTDGELGNGSVAADSLLPVTVSNVTGAIAIASDGNHSYCALTASGGVDCWGLGISGELGDNALVSSDVAVAVSGLAGATSLASEGNGSYCALLADGTVDCWGDNGSGDLGDNSTTDSPVPVAVSGLGSVVSLVSDGGHSYCAAQALGTVECWGNGTSGELGDGANSTSHVPVSVTGITSATSVASNGNNSYCALLAGGSVECWGLGTIGQLGDGATASSNIPVTVTGVGNAETMAGDDANSYCVTLATESVQCWGAGTMGQLGNGSALDSDVPVTVTPMAPAVAIVGEGSGTFCAPLASNAVNCWGSNGSGALGSGSVAGQSDVPMTVSALTL